MSATTTPRTVNRRDFLKLTGLAGGGFALAFQIRSARGGATSRPRLLASIRFTR